MYDSTTKYNGLVKAIAKQLGIDTTIKELEIKYLVSDRCPPISIHNDTSVQVYLDQKKYNMDFFSKFPLCITCIDRAMDAFDFRTDAQSSYQSNNMEIYLFCTSDAIHLSDIRPTVEDDVLKFSGVEIISNPQNESVEESQVYIDKHTLSEVMKRYSFLRQFRFIAARSCHKSGLFKIREFCGKHSCTLKDNIYSERQTTTDVIGSMLIERLADSKIIYTPRDIIGDIKRSHGISLTYMQAWRGKKKATTILRGNPAESYGKIPPYLYILETTYPGTIVRLKKRDEDLFLYAFVALDACIRGWEYCRPIMVIDGTHLRSTYEGTMLTSTTSDAGGHILPLAYAIVDSENNASWSWFFECFSIAYEERKNICFVSGRNQSI
ncbi:hypothetical protein P3L10_018093 [Capsicum annuum]